ncbi:MAG: CoB--CoM heterodisulfide reductase iron-sulfur subunit A family protein [Deltaproteobacteria bacterium]|nr:CoB--CoM heterodisulfide reductase iron-sulfur subunit A family protein [Deltaproteobacteria bacterium]
MDKKTTNSKVMIVGGGISGLMAALSLDSLGIGSIIVEKSPNLGGKVKEYSQVFPDFRSGKNITKELIDRVKQTSRILTLVSTTATSMEQYDGGFSVATSDSNRHDVGAIIVACGFDVFDARRQEEYGYGVYPNVINSLELESLLGAHETRGGKLLRPSDGKPVDRLAIIFCVGSRSKRLGNPYCSRICCSYSTKQAIEIMEMNPDASVTCFYMDIRTYDRGFEEMYQYAQELGVKYIRGRVSECSALPNGDIQVRAENTLLGRPVQGVFELVSLSVGMMPCPDAENIARLLDIERSKDGFFTRKDSYFYPHDTNREGIFLAGTVTGLKPIKDCLTEATAVGSRVAAYLNGK